MENKPTISLPQLPPFTPEKIFLLAFDAPSFKSSQILELKKQQQELAIDREKTNGATYISWISGMTSLIVLGIQIFSKILIPHSVGPSPYNIQSPLNTSSSLSQSSYFNKIIIAGQFLSSLSFIFLICYTNITSLELVVIREGVKQHKQLGKLCYITGLLSSFFIFLNSGINYSFQDIHINPEEHPLIGYSSSQWMSLALLSILQLFFLLMSLACAMCKYLVSHRIWSYCLSALHLQVSTAFILSYSFPTMHSSVAQRIAASISIGFLILQEKILNITQPATTPTFQISLDLAENSQEDTPVSLKVSSTQGALKLWFVSSLSIWMLLKVTTSQEKYLNYYEILEFTMYSSVILISLFHLFKRIGVIKKIKKIRKALNKKPNNKGDDTNNKDKRIS